MSHPASNQNCGPGCECYNVVSLGDAPPRSPGRRVYADHNATTPLDPTVLDAMLPYLRDRYGNASSIHHCGRQARAAIDDARARVARLLGGEEGEIIFTSGGTEADNLAILGCRQGHVIASSIEHHAVLHPAEKRHATFLSVRRDGIVDPAELPKALRPDTVLVSVMSANNETGARQPVKELAAICRQQGVLFHTDAVQSFGKEPVNVREWDVDLLSISAHKFHGPKGAGVLFVRRGVMLEPQILGGSQERERRGGTENVAGIVGLAAAAELAVARLAEEGTRLRALTEDFAGKVLREVPGAMRNGHPQNRVPNTVNFSFAGCTIEGLLIGLDLEGVAVSSGAACTVGSLRPSHVIQAMGLPVTAAIRFSFGAGNDAADVDYIVAALGRVVRRLQGTTGREQKPAPTDNHSHIS
jgi:cysteine desulfurase